MSTENKTKTDVSRYIVNVQGKDFITFPGLLAEAHAQGLVDIKTDLINTDMKSPVMRATVILNVDGKNKTFTGFGDANEGNVAKKVAGALIRMCETRAIARALRFACNIDMAALEELDSEENVINNAPKAAPVAAKGFVKPTVTVTSPGNKVETKQVDETTTQVTVSGPTPPAKEEVKTEPAKKDPFKFARRTSTKTEPNFP